MHYTVRHTTTYSYTDTVSICQNDVHLMPRQTPFQTTAGFLLEVSPEPMLQRSWIDTFGNEVRYFSLEEPHQELRVTARSRITVMKRELPSPFETCPWETARDQLLAAETAETRLMSQFRFESPYVQYLNEARDYALPSFTPGRPLLEAALDLTSRIYHEFEYAPAATSISTPTKEVLEKRRGVCQDFAHLQITALRSLGLAARYVSGYLVTAPPPGKPKLVGADASHAWLAVLCPGHGWIDLDPTNNVIPQERHITIGWGRDYGDVCPIKGVLTGGGSHVLTVSVDVAPVPIDAA
jgi:transglutaminase-like putative cysteine protease